jgi:alpha-tubulin suppressor-like RCC1 family protein
MRDSRVMGVCALCVALLCLPATAVASEGGSAVVGWGKNLNEQLDAGYQTEGSGEDTEETPVRALGLTDVLETQSGFEDGLALLENHTIVGWGSSLFGQLGSGAYGRLGSPVTVDDQAHEPQTEVKQFSEAGDHGMALLKSGRVVTWGDSMDGQRGNGESGTEEDERELGNKPLDRAYTAEVSGLEHVKQVVEAGTTDYALLENGHIMAWGSNGNGKLGIGEEPGGTKSEPKLSPEACKVEKAEDACSTSPREVELPTLPEGVSVASIAAGYDTGYALLSDGRVLAWGDGVDGALGDESRESSDVPVYVSDETVAACPEFSSDTHCPVVKVDGGKLFAWGLLASGEVIGWGTNNTGQLGSESTEECAREELCSLKPKLVVGAEYGKVSEISTNRENGGLFLVGTAMYGLGSFEGELTRTPELFEGLGPVLGITGGEGANFATLKEGEGPVPLMTLIPESNALTIKWTGKAPTVNVRITIIAVKGVEEKGASSKAVAVPSTECSTTTPCSYTFTEVRKGEPLTSEDEYKVRLEGAPPRLADGTPLP